MISNNSRCALWIAALLLGSVAADSGYAQTARPIGRLSPAKARLLGTTNFTKAASAGTGLAPAPDLLDLPGDAASELRRREMVDSLAADRENPDLAAKISFLSSLSCSIIIFAEKLFIDDITFDKFLAVAIK